MFGTELPDPKAHPAMMRNAQHAFALLQRAVEAVHAQREGPGPHPTTNHDALFIWSTLHGLAGALQSQAIRTIDLSDAEIDAAIPEVMERMGRSVFGPG